MRTKERERGRERERDVTWEICCLETVYESLSDLHSVGNLFQEEAVLSHTLCAKGAEKEKEKV
jgi:hypothetical protein